MKKFKLIREYPGSPKLGTELTPKTDMHVTNTNNYYWEGSWFNPSDFPEFWEEVVVPDYEVYQVSYATEIRTLFDGGYRIHPAGIGFDLDYLLTNGGKIHSVKRLSDGKIFTVGDRIDIGGRNGMFFRTISMINISSDGTLVIDHEHGGLTNSKSNGIFNKIEPAPLDYEILSYAKKDNPKCHTMKRRGGERHDEFWNIRVVKRLSDGEVFKVGDVIQTYKDGSKHRIKSISLAKETSSLKKGIWVNYEGGAQHFSNTIKVKNKLLTTEDGVDIYVGDQTWILHKNSWHLSPKPTKHNNENWFQSEEPAHWSFSNKEAAEAYMLNNKPCLSLDDIRRSLNLPTSQINYLVKLIKNKLWAR
jgi:hypothetical protein